MLEALAALEQKAPVAGVVDDAQRADIDSFRALLFVARRLVRERVLLVLAERIEDAMRLPRACVGSRPAGPGSRSPCS